MSGGVDSSVSAALLKSAATPKDFEKIFGRPTPEGFRGFEVIGVHIKMWSDPSIPCNFKEDRYDAMRAAEKIGIPFQTWDFTEEYRTAVVEYMIGEYAAGRTPNPDVMCNRHIKFGVFLRRALARGADYIATGHYARIERVLPSSLRAQRSNLMGLPRRSHPFTPRNDNKDSHQLLQARDKNKDQSYFLWTLTQEQLRYCLFPIGDYTKPEVREIARNMGLPTAEKRDSQGICFIGEIDLNAFLKKYILMRPGLVRTTGGREVGTHEGLSFYTIGQRQGLGIGGGGIPYYVADKDFRTNTLTIAEGPYDEKLFTKTIPVADVNWISGIAPKLPMRCEARIRYRQPLQQATIELGIKNKELGAQNKNLLPTSYLLIRFDEPQRAATPGQSAVFYRGDEMLGGGIIA